MNEPSGEGWSCTDEDWEAWMGNALDSKMSSKIVTGDYESQVEGELQDWINGEGGVKIAFKLYGLVIDEDISESQPNLFLNIVVPPTDYEIKKITVREIERHWQTQQSGSTDIDGKEKISCSLVDDGVDYAVERATLPGKEINMYLGRKRLAGYAVRQNRTIYRCATS